MSFSILDIKKKIYHEASMVFPTYFKNRDFENVLKGLQNKHNVELLPEKELLVLSFFAQKNWTVIDVGANNGLYSYFFKDIVKCSTVAAFEPLPNLYTKLKKWFTDVEIFPIALSNSTGKATIHIPIINHNRYETRAKLDDLKEENETDRRELQINIDTLDNIYHQQKWNDVNFIKIDVEGHELGVIEGAQEVIKKFNPFLLVEIEGRHHNNSVNEVVNRICQFGYEAYFFNYTNKQISPFALFDEATMQLSKNQNTFAYTNNFLFFPTEKKNKVEEINQKLKQFLQ